MEGVQVQQCNLLQINCLRLIWLTVITYTRQSWGNAENGDGSYVVPKDIVEYKPKI